jgi:mannose-6-phosphate isomerase-like protein (cupin superfamily)
MCVLLSGPASAQQIAGQPQPPPTDPTKLGYMSAADLAAALSKLGTDRPASSVRVFTMAPYRVAVEHLTGQPQIAAIHEAEAELFYVISGSATIVTGGELVEPTRNGTNLLSKGITGGTAQKISPGDFVFVPPGLPHVLTDVQGVLDQLSLHLPMPK